ncbi:MAG TPA: cytochrome d ubiquinol oxidase subunit II, partial [Plasticicumulans sp.]|nr:cytochrome d ubiquinol oxidase subunit II [Plasticicumulans sp.]
MNGIDYDLLRLGAWALAGLSLFGFALTAGFDLGIGTLLPVLGRSDAERGRLIGTIEGHWEGNQTWFVVAGGLLFALWPPVYAVLLSGLTPLLLVALFGLMLRPAGFGFRHQIDDPRWRRLWDGVLCAGGVLPALAFGALLARLFAGLPFRHEGDALQPVFEAAPAHAAAWLPFTVVCAVLVLALFAQHGAARLLFSVRGV